MTFCLPLLHAQAVADSPRQPEENYPNYSKCMASIPVSSVVAGLLSIQWNCESKILWGVGAGGAAFGYRHWAPFINGTLGIRYRSRFEGHQSTFTASSIDVDSPWEVRLQLRSVLIPERAFQAQGAIQKGSLSWLKTPSLQQWNLLSKNDISFEFRSTPKQLKEPFIHFYGVELWQLVPPAWRTLGAFRDTKNIEMQGIIAKAYAQSHQWSANFGLGRMNVEVDQVTASFFYPAIEVSYHLFETRPLLLPSPAPRTQSQ